MAIALTYYGRLAVARETALAWARAVAAREGCGAFPAEHEGYSGLALNLHPAAEPFALLLDSGGERLEGKVRTSGAGPGYHEMCVTLLDELRDLLVPDLAVEDDAGFWESRERARLEERMVAWRVAVGERILSLVREGRPNVLFALPEGSRAGVPAGHVGTALGIVTAEEWERATEDVRRGRDLARHFPWWGPGKDARYHASLAVALLNVRDFAGDEADRLRFGRALDAADRALALDPDADLPRARLAAAAERLGEPERAIPHVAAAVERAPRDHGLRFSLATLLEAVGRREEAAAAFEELAARRPSDAGVAYNAGYLWSLAGDFARAVALLERAALLAPRKSPYHAELAVALSGLGRHEDALEAARRAVALEPEAASNRATLAQCLALAGRLEEALEEADRALALEDAPAFREIRADIQRALEGGG